MKKDYNGKLNLYALLQDYKGIDKNENSIVSWFGRDNLSYLFMGDCGNEGENNYFRIMMICRVTFLNSVIMAVTVVRQWSFFIR